MEEITKQLAEFIERLASPEDRLIPAIAKAAYRAFAELQNEGFTRDEALQIVCSMKLGKM